MTRTFTFTDGFLRYAVKEKHSVPILCSPIRAGFGPTQSVSMQHSPLRSSGRRILNYLDDWLILAQSLDMLISRIDSLLIHLESLGLCVNMQKIARRPFYLPYAVSAKAALFSWRIFRDSSDSGRWIHWYVIWDYYTCACCSYGWNLKSRGLRDVCASRSPAAASKLWRNPDLFSRGVPLCSVVSRVVVTTDASTHGWGAVCEGMPASGLWLESQSRWHINRLELEAVFLALKDFQPQLEQQHVLIRTDNTSVVSDINHHGGIRSRALCKQATDCHPLHQSSVHPRSPDPRGGHAFEEGDSSRRVEIAPRVGSDDLEPLTLRESGDGSVRHEQERALPVVLLPVSLPTEGDTLTSRWPAARPYAFPLIKKCCHWCYARSGRSEHQLYLSPRTSLGSQTWRNCWRHRLGRSPAGSICYPRWTARCGTPTWNYGAFMCDRFRGIRGDGRLTVLRARHAHGSANTLYNTFVCFKMGSVGEMVWSGSYRPGYLHRIVCSEFPAAQTG